MMINWLKKFRASHVRNFWWMLSLTVVILTFLRIIFYFLHRNAFPHVNWTDWVTGLAFDWITVCIFFLPYAIIHFLPFFHRNNSVYRIFSKVYFFLVNVILLLLNLVDLEYFSYTSKRSTADLFAITSAGSDIQQLIGTFLIEFWWMWLIFIAFLLLLSRAYNKVIRAETKMTRADIFPHSVLMLVHVGVVILIGRGGWGLRPIGTIEAAQYTSANNTALVLNTGFTMMKSYGKDGLEPLAFYSEERAAEIFNPIRKTQPAKVLKDKSNVVIILLESFGNEWMAFNNPQLTKS